MRAMLQRVLRSSVTVEGEIVGSIGPGLLILVGVGPDDTMRDVEYLADKTVNLRIFEDAEGKMNCSLLDVGGAALAVSQFTLYGDCRKGRRPSFTGAAPPELGETLYQAYSQALRGYGITVEQGRFGAHMQVELVNDGPVTIFLDSERFKGFVC